MSTLTFQSLQTMLIMPSSTSSVKFFYNSWKHKGRPPSYTGLSWVWSVTCWIWTIWGFTVLRMVEGDCSSCNWLCADDDYNILRWQFGLFMQSYVECGLASLDSAFCAQFRIEKNGHHLPDCSANCCIATMVYIM